MLEILKLQKKIVPEMLELLEKRYGILRTIYYNEPVGRRMLANKLGVGERIVRTEINFLSEQNLITVSTPGMNLTAEGEEVIDGLKDFIHELKGLSHIEKYMKQELGIKDVLLIPGDVEEDETVMDEIGRVAAVYIKGLLKNKKILALTGGTTVKKVVDNFPKGFTYKDLLVVPARGGMGKNVETQANTLTANLANKIGSNYRLLHVPDNLSAQAIDTIQKEDSIKEVLDYIHNADILVYGIGKAEQMAKRRGLVKDQIQELNTLQAVGEAFGYYFNTLGHVVYKTATIGIQNEDRKNIKELIAVAGGKVKAEAIIAVMKNSSNGTLITDEGTASEIMKLLK